VRYAKRRNADLGASLNRKAALRCVLLSNQRGHLCPDLRPRFSAMETLEHFRKIAVHSETQRGPQLLTTREVAK